MQQDHAEMPTWPKKEPEANSRDVVSRTSRTYAVLTAYTRHFNHIWYTAKEPSYQNVSNSFVVKIQDCGGRHTEFRKKCKYLRGRLRATTTYCKMAFSLHVVESVSDDEDLGLQYNF